jgi:hypothetical protein
MLPGPYLLSQITHSSISINQVMAYAFVNVEMQAACSLQNVRFSTHIIDAPPHNIRVPSINILWVPIQFSHVSR